MYQRQVTPHYYLDIAGVVIKISCPNDLYLFDDWSRFFTQYLKEFLVPKQKSCITFCFDGVRTKGLTVIPNTVKDEITLPSISGNTVFFDNFFHPAIFLSVLYKVVKPRLLKNDKLILHASGVVVNNKAVLFIGNSGDGKSTAHSKLSPACQSLGDDSVVVSLEGNSTYAYPTPINLKVNGPYARNSRYEITRIVFLRKSRKLSLKKIPSKNAFPLIVNQVKHSVRNSSSAKLLLAISRDLSEKTYVLSSSINANISEIMKKD